MTVLPLDRLGFGWRSHLSALWWLFLLYRRPKEFADALKPLPKIRQVQAGLLSYFHAAPWLLSVCVVGRSLLFGSGLVELRSPGNEQNEAIWMPFQEIILGLVFGLAFGLAFGFAMGLAVLIVEGVAVAIVEVINFVLAVGFVTGAVWLAFGLVSGLARRLTVEFARGLALGLAFGVAFGFSIAISIGMSFGISIAVVLGFSIGFAVGLAVEFVRSLAAGFAVGLAAGFAVGLGFGFAVGLGFGFAVGIAITRIYYHAVVELVIWSTPRGWFYPWHPVAWDDMCSVPFPRLERLLIAYFERAPDAARKEVERLLDTYPSQRWASLKAKTAIVSRDASGLTDLTRLPDVLASLPEGDEGFLGQVPKLRELALPIAERQRQFDDAFYPTVRKQLAELLIQQIENFRDQIAGFEEPLSTEFRAAAAHWLDLVRGRFAAALVTQTRVTEQLFRAGDPVNREQEAFVPRTAIVAEVESQVLLATGCPGVILSGHRRMGKSTVLKNLAGFLPSFVSVGYVSMQNPLAFVSLAGFCQTLAASTRVARRWPSPPPTDPTDLPGLMRFLTSCDRQLGSTKERLILAIDEYEMLDRKITEGVFGPDLLATLRESIQTHRNITWVLAGSHEIAELTGAEWSSYLVSARTVEVLPFTLAETRQLLTDPVKHSGLWKDATKRPRFSEEFWGTGRIEQIHTDAGGWPHLVQLLAEQIVDLLNAEGTGAVTDDLYRQARAKAVVRGDTVLRQLLRGECMLPGEWEYLSRFRRVDSQQPPDDEQMHRSLRRRLLVEEASGGDWRLRVPLMLQWLRERG